VVPKQPSPAATTTSNGRKNNWSSTPGSISAATAAFAKQLVIVQTTRKKITPKTRESARTAAGMDQRSEIANVSWSVGTSTLWGEGLLLSERT
jgi:hypothetical protein